ncbi:MAG: hypothetical protein LBR55_03085 [Bacteroidales bacterium]|jgi:hypothetical protein|nr:hypothetical protein [Bacteroidales bacterium]
MIKRQFAIILTCVFFLGQTFAQETPTHDFFVQMKNYDLSVVLTTDTIIEVDEKFPRSEILGFIGDDYQRLHIHFISIIQNQSNPYEYFAYGKTKVKNNVCEFQGIIKIKEAKMYVKGDYSEKYLQGYTICEVVLYEDQKQSSTGFIGGQLKSNFCIDTEGNFQYDAIMSVADGFCNNQFVGTWTSYKTGKSKTCNWGDGRIPKSENLDSGAGEFIVSEKYVKNGWENYKLAWQTYPETQEVIKARQKENEKWWK